MTSERRLSDVGDFIRQHREAAHQSVRDLAKSAGISNPYLSQIERGLRKPSAKILQQLAHALRISAETLYERAGMFDSHEPSVNGVVVAIANDKWLDAEQKHTLLSVYKSFTGHPLSD